MKLSGIDHVALTCESVEATQDWYVRVLGFEHVFPGAWDGVPVFLKLGATYLALFPLRGTPQPAPGSIISLSMQRLRPRSRRPRSH